MDTNYFRIVTEDLFANRDEVFKGSEAACLAKADGLFAEGYDDATPTVPLPY